MTESALHRRGCGTGCWRLARDNIGKRIRLGRQARASLRAQHLTSPDQRMARELLEVINSAGAKGGEA